jgi:spore coat polysaccharide biosynthesis protein SpsF (cytidylyltransferase family)
MKIVALLQARTDSTRLPKKVLKLLLDKPMIIHQLERIKKSHKLDELILVTSKESNDDELANVVKKENFKVYRGSKDNVLKRYYKCAKKLKLKDDDIVVRLTGDCPLHDAEIIDEIIDAFIQSDCDYMTNSVEPLYPDGFDVEVFKFSALKKAYLKAEKLSEKEHVTPFIRESGLFKTENLNGNFIHPEWRLTVDEPKDFDVIEKIYNYFGDNNFSFQDIVSYLEENPKIVAINSTIKRNEGYEKSLQTDLKRITNG